MNKVRFTMVLFLTLSFFCKAGVSFCGSEVKHLFEILPDSVQGKVLDLLDNKSSVPFVFHIKTEGKNIIISGCDKKIDHIGIQLGNLSFVNKYDSIVKLFFERAFLKFWHEKNIMDIESSAESMQCRLFYQDKPIKYSPLRDFNELFSFIDKANSYSLKKDNHFFLIQWQKDSIWISMRFPNDNQLITGKNKKELDEELCLKLSGNVVRDSSVVEYSDRDSLPGNIAVSIMKGKSFMEHFSSDVFYKKIGNDSIPIFDKNFIHLSLSNLFLNNEISGNRVLHLRHKLYGKDYISYDIQLKEFISFFKDDFDVYAGMENSNPDAIEGSAIFSHKYFNFIHLLHFITDSNNVFNNTGKINAEFYANIPMHNVSNLVQEYKTDNTMKKTELIINNP